MTLDVALLRRKEARKLLRSKTPAIVTEAGVLAFMEAVESYADEMAERIAERLQAKRDDRESQGLDHFPRLDAREVHSLTKEDDTPPKAPSTGAQEVKRGTDAGVEAA